MRGLLFFDQHVEDAQVAARFPEPNVSFATPAFEAGRTAFTTNDELYAFLQRLARSRMRRSGEITLRLDVENPTFCDA